MAHNVCHAPQIINEMLPDIHTMEICYFLKPIIHSQIQSTLVISKSKGPSKTLRDIRTSTYQICSIEEKNNLNNQISQMIMLCDFFSYKYILKILWKRGEIAPHEQFLLFSTIFCNPILDFGVKTRTKFSLRDKR